MIKRYWIVAALAALTCAAPAYAGGTVRGKVGPGYAASRKVGPSYAASKRFGNVAASRRVPGYAPAGRGSQTLPMIDSRSAAERARFKAGEWIPPADYDRMSRDRGHFRPE